VTTTRILRRSNTRIQVTREVHATYRLAAPVPVLVTFPSVSYWVVLKTGDNIAEDPQQCVHELVLRRVDRGMPRTIVRVWSQRAFEGVFQHGLSVPAPSLIDTVLTRMVLIGAAERIAGPHAKLYFMGLPRPGPDLSVLVCSCGVW